MINENKKAVYLFLSAYFLLWIVFFEFIFPVNNILPKPSIVIQSFPYLISDYLLFPNYLSTVAVIYLSLLLAYIAVRLVILLPGKENHTLMNFIFSLEWFSEYIPGIVLGLFLIFWFPASEYIEFIFAFFSALIPMIFRLQKASLLIPGEYISSSRSLGLTDSFINRKIIWKFTQTEILKSLKFIHFNLWLVLIAFEYIKGGYGIGNIFQKALSYNDLSAFFSAAIITGSTIFLGDLIISNIYRKIIFWK